MSNEIRLEIIHLIQRGKLTTVKNDPILREYYLQYKDEFQNLLNGYDYPKRNNHIEYLGLFAFGKMTTVVRDLTSTFRTSLGAGNSLDATIEELIRKDKLFNDTFHRVEKETIGFSAQSNHKVHDLMNDGNDNLVFLTQDDEKVRTSHRVRHGIIRPKNDPFWTSNLPPLAFNCRCYVSSTNEPVNDTGSPDFKEGVRNKAQTLEDFSSYFENYILPKDHPYIINIKRNDLSLKEKWDN